MDLHTASTCCIMSPYKGLGASFEKAVFWNKTFTGSASPLCRYGGPGRLAEGMPYSLAPSEPGPYVPPQQRTSQAPPRLAPDLVRLHMASSGHPVSIIPCNKRIHLLRIHWACAYSLIRSSCRHQSKKPTKHHLMHASSCNRHQSSSLTLC